MNRTANKSDDAWICISLLCLAFGVILLNLSLLDTRAQVRALQAQTVPCILVTATPEGSKQ